MSIIIGILILPFLALFLLSLVAFGLSLAVETWKMYFDWWWVELRARRRKLAVRVRKAGTIGEGGLWDRELDG